MGVHIIILYASERKIVAEGFGLRSRQREDLQSGMERKTPDYAKNSNSTTLKSAVGGYGIPAVAIAKSSNDSFFQPLMATAGMPLPPTFALPTALFYLHSTWCCGGRRPPLLREIANDVQSDGGRNLIGRRTESDRMADATKGQKLRLRHEKRYGERHTLL